MSTFFHSIEFSHSINQKMLSETSYRVHRKRMYIAEYVVRHEVAVQDMQ